MQTPSARLVHELRGGCLCGALRYLARVETLADCAYCHCETCRRAHGAPVVTWLTVPRQGFSYMKGQPKVFASSAQGERRFCPTCGSQLEFRSHRTPGQIDLAVACLDAPVLAPPRFHIFHSRHLPWFEIADNLPRHAREDDSAL